MKSIPIANLNHELRIISWLTSVHHCAIQAFYSLMNRLLKRRDHVFSFSIREVSQLKSLPLHALYPCTWYSKSEKICWKKRLEIDELGNSFPAFKASQLSWLNSSKVHVIISFLELPPVPQAPSQSKSEVKVRCIELDYTQLKTERWLKEEKKQRPSANDLFKVGNVSNQFRPTKLKEKEFSSFSFILQRLTLPTMNSVAVKTRYFRTKYDRYVEVGDRNEDLEI